MSEQNKGKGPTVRVVMGKPADRRSGEIRVDADLLSSKEEQARRAEIRRCQQERLDAEAAGTCLMLDCPFDAMECSEVATDWLLAHRGDEHLMRELADDPTLGHDPRKPTALVTADRDWFRIVRAIPALREMAFSRMRGFALVVSREEVVRLAMETDTPLTYESLLRMLRVTGLELSAELRAELKEHLVRAGADLGLWEGLLDDDDPDEFDLAPAMLVARDHAKFSAALHYADWDQMEYWLLGILRVAKDGVAPFDRFLFNEQGDRDFKRDVRKVRAVLSEQGLDIDLFKVQLHNVLRHTRGTGRSKRRECWKAAEERAQLRGETGVWMHDVTTLCLCDQTEALRQAIDRYRAKFG